MARAYFELHRHDEALEAVHRALAKAYGGRKLQIRMLEADILMARGRQGEAKRALERALVEAKETPLPARYFRTREQLGSGWQQRRERAFPGAGRLLIAGRAGDPVRVSAAMIQIGDRIPDATLFESTEFGEACPVAPKKVSVAESIRGKRIVIFGLPGAYTPTCSAKHVPGYVAQYDALRAKNIDEIWCLSVNDGYVMAAWGRDEKALGKVRMLGDGSAELTKKLGLENDLSASGMGIRTRRFSMLIDDGVVKQLNVEAPSKFEVSDAETMLKQLG